MIKVCLKMGYIPPIHGMSTSEIMLKRFGKIWEVPHFQTKPHGKMSEMDDQRCGKSTSVDSTKIFAHPNRIKQVIRQHLSEQNKVLAHVHSSLTSFVVSDLRFIRCQTQLFTLWKSNVAMDNCFCMDDFPIYISTYRWNSIAIFDYQRVHHGTSIFLLGIWGQQLPQTLAGWALHVLVWLGVVRIVEI